MTQSGSSQTRTTPLAGFHRRLGARMGEFAGYTLPIRYETGIIAEHNAVRESAGLFDVSHMGQIAIKGRDAARVIGRVSPMDAASLKVGACKYGLLLNRHAGILDDFILSRLADDRFLAVVNAANSEADLTRFAAEAEEMSVSINCLPRAMVAVQGPVARQAVARQIPQARHLSFMTAMELADGRFLSATGYTGEDGFEIALSAAAAEEFAEAVLAGGPIRPIGLGARDSLRLEAGLCLHGQDLTTDTNPYEAGLGWCLSRKVVEAGGYCGDDALRAAAASPPVRRLAGLMPEGRAPVRAGTRLFSDHGEQIGTVTSGGFAPTLSRPIAMGYIAARYSVEGGTVHAEVRGRRIPCEVASLPFVRHRYWRATRK